jgi:predicted nucleic acid-binding protein
LDPIIDFLVVGALVVSAPALPEQICADPDDDKFLACAIASAMPLIVSGDRHLLEVNGYRGIRILRPRDFLDELTAIDRK